MVRNLGIPVVAIVALLTPAVDAQTADPAPPVRELPGNVEPRRPPPKPPEDPAAVPLPPPSAFPKDFVPIPDRWRLVETLGIRDNWLDPYNRNALKGDRPLFGKDWFVVLTGISDTVYEPRTVPTPVGIQTGRPGSNDVFGGSKQSLISQTFIASAALIKGDTAFKPPDFEGRLALAFNYNNTDAQERRFLEADPTHGTTRIDSFVGVQEAFLDFHLRNVSERYDFDSVRVGIQPFSSDFRGFLFQDNQFGARLFGNRENNLWQYNLAWFRLVEKDTNSGLNDVGEGLRNNDVLVANLYRQDFPIVGLTSQASLIYNRNRDDDFVDENGFPARPAEIGFGARREYDVTYAGLNLDGRIGDINLTASGYLAGGTNKNSILSNRESDIRAYFLAVEPSMDFDWFRVRLSGLYASGDSDPYDDKDEGFDAIFENPQFAGADTSYWIRQGVPFIGGGFVGLSGRNGVLPSLRSSKELGQSNFTNPGLTLLGGGVDFDVLPELRVSFNANYLRFNETAVLEALRQQGDISNEIGWDLSTAIIWRPFLNQNVVLRLSGAVLLPGQGMDELYGSDGGDDYYYSILANIVLTY